MMRRIGPLSAAAVLAGLVAWVYLPTLSQGWAPIDDGLNFVRNEHFRGLGWDELRWMWTTRLAGHYIPLSWMTLGADYLVSGMDPRGYHRTNLLLHLANALLFFALAKRLVREASEAPNAPTPAADPERSLTIGAFAAAAFFALHPLRVESVAWVTERRDLLCGLFCLLATHAYVSFAAAEGRRRRLALGWALGAFAAALLAKGSAVVLPIAFLALDAGPLRRLEPDAGGWSLQNLRALLREKAGFFLLAVGSAAWTLWAIAPVAFEAKNVTLEHRLLAASFGLTFYLSKSFLPFSIPFQIPTTELLTVTDDPDLALRGVGLVALFGGALVLWWRRGLPGPALALFVYAAFVLPVSGLLQAGPQLAAHRYTYLATMPFALAVGWATRRASESSSRRSRWVVATVAGAMAIFLATAARAQVELWRDPVTFCRAAVRGAPRAWQPVGALVRAHLSRGEEREALLVLRAGRGRFPSALLFPYLESLVLATSPNRDLRDGSLALQLAEPLVRTTSSQDPSALLAMGAALAEAGDSVAARRFFDAGLALAQAGRKPELAPALDAALDQLARSGQVRFSSDDWSRLLL